MALTTFVSQNLGAKRYDRVRKGVLIGTACCAGISEIIAGLIWLFSPSLIGLFVSDPEAIAYGVMHQRTLVLFFCLAAYTHSIAAVLRGAGKSAVAMAGMAICWCVVRVPYVTIAVRLRPMLTTVSWAYPITWTLSSIFFTVYYLKGHWMRKESAAGL
jgi:Na+-driven multidrug efflux pump